MREPQRRAVPDVAQAGPLEQDMKAKAPAPAQLLTQTTRVGSIRKVEEFGNQRQLGKAAILRLSLSLATGGKEKVSAKSLIAEMFDGR